MYWDLHEECNEDWKDVISALLAITEMQEFQESTKPRVLMASALRRVFNHISDTDYLNLANSSLGKWLLASMSRSFRELRIAAVQGLMVFLRDDIASPVKEENRMSTLGFFQTLSKKDTLYVHETLIMAYGQAARVCGEDELPIILLQLVEYLGHTSTLICGMAYTEIDAIAEALHLEVKELLRPFWRSIGVAVFKDFHNKPQNAQQLADLCEQHVSELLLSTQAEILPHLVLTKRKEMLQRIATARRTSIQDVCMQPRRHLANIIALLLCQPVNDVEKSAMEALVAVAPGFRENGYDLSDLIKLEPVLVACEILKMMTDQPTSTKAQASTNSLHCDIS
jgi:serine/threonine-protein kinase ATR